MEDYLRERVRALLVQISEEIIHDIAFYRPEAAFVQTLEKLDKRVTEIVQVIDASEK